MNQQHARTDQAHWPKQTRDFTNSRQVEWGPAAEVIETTLLLPADLFTALEATARQHQMTIGQMTRIMIGLCVMSPELAGLAGRSNFSLQPVRISEE